MSKKNQEIVIVGGGASGAITVQHLLASCLLSQQGEGAATTTSTSIDSTINITVIDRRAVDWRGWAYSSPAHYHLLNVPKEGMSANERNPNEFVEYIKDGIAKGTVDAKWDEEEHGHVSRWVFGSYLVEKTEALIAEATCGENLKAGIASVSVRKVVGEVVGVEKAEKNVLIVKKADDTQAIPFTHCVVATGNLAPKVIPAFKSIEHAPGFIKTPWLWPEEEHRVSRTGTIAIVGSRLTAIDFILHLKYKCGYTGHAFVISRSGKFPKENPGEKLAPKIDNSYLQCHLEEFKNGSMSVEKLEQILRQKCAELRQLQKESGDTSVDVELQVVDSLRPFTNIIWQNLPQDQRAAFLGLTEDKTANFRGEFETRRHRTAPGQIQLVNQLLESGQFVSVASAVVSSHMQEVDTNPWDPFPDKIVLNLENGQQIACDTVVNCTGPDQNYKEMLNVTTGADHHDQDPFLTSLVQNGVAVPDECGVGFLTTPNTGALTSSHTTAATENPAATQRAVFYTVGPPRRGSDWECIAIKEIALNAAEVSASIMV